MKILEEIVAHKREEVQTHRELYPVKRLEQSIYFETPPVSLKAYLQRPDLIGVIAEIKRCSPSKGDINEFVDVESVSIGYMQAGASALSVLTDKKFFGGNSEDLTIARKFNFCPILRKDFVIDEYQVVEAKSMGADVILLIASLLTPEQIISFAHTAHSLGLEVLVEVHSEDELRAVPFESIDILGVNNRNLDTFVVDTNTSHELLSLIPEEIMRISESGIHSPETLVELQKAGFHGFLIGERFMEASRPEEACAAFITKAKELSSED